jgi:streptogramin lyase
MIFVDSWNNRIRRLSGWIVNTVAGGSIGEAVPATSAALVFPQSAAFDKSGNMYIAEYTGNRVRRVSTTGTITTFAGNGTSGYSGDGGRATSAQLYLPQDAIADAAGNVFISDQWNNVIRKVDTLGNISTFSADLQFGGGLAFMAFDPLGNLYVTDVGACMVWKLDANGNATGVAGVPFVCGYNGDNIAATNAQLNAPFGIAFDPAGNLYIGDSGNNRVRKVSTTGVITTFAGDGTICALSTDPCGDGGPPTSAQFNFPVGIAIAKGVLYISDEGDVRIRRVANGIVTTVAGTGNSGYNGNGLPALSTNLDDPIGVGVNPVNGVLYLVDDVQSRVRAVH